MPSRDTVAPLPAATAQPSVAAGPASANRANPPARLQRTLGNQTVQALLRSGRLHPKLALPAASDPEEREADELAAHVLSRSPAPPCAACAAGVTPCPTCREARPLRRKTEADTPDLPSTSETSALPSLRGGGHPLPPPLRAFFEPRFGTALEAVRLHDDPATAADARSIRARAFALGSDIGFAAGEYAPHTPSGQALLAHELAHVALHHSGVRRIEDSDLIMRHEWQERQAAEAAERERRHQAWVGGVNRQFSRDLGNQATTTSEERERIELALTTQRAAAFDEAATGKGWLNEALTQQGYSGPGLAEVKQAWAEALVAAELLKLGSTRGTLTTDARLAGLQAIPIFYTTLATFAQAAEEAHRTRVEAENTRLRTQYEARLTEYRQRERYDRMSQGPIGEPGERAFRAGQAIARGSPPSPPTYLTAPPAITGQIPAATTRLYAADTDADWAAVATEVNRLGNGLATLVVASLPASSATRTGIEYLEQLDTRLAALEAAHPLAVRIPAVFYPKDRTLSRKDDGGEAQVVPEAIPWQFYLINTGVTSHDQPARSGGEWVLIDLTSSQRFENREPASDFDSARLQQGEAVDPPIALFSHLNSKIRFPEGRIFFTLPRGQSYYVVTTEPWSLSDFFSAIGMALAAIALVAAVVATGGAAAPAAVAFYAGIGAAAAGVGSSLAQMHEKREQGILTSADVDNAMISIAIDIVTAASMGLGRLVALPRAAARLGLTGERFIALQRITQVARAGALAGDVYQAWSLTSGLVTAFTAIDNQPGLSDEERRRMRAQLVRRALLTGALLTVAIRGDIKDLQAGRTLRVSHVDADGALVVPHGSEATPHPGTDTPHGQPDAPGAPAASRTSPHAAPHAAPHADVTGPVHTDAGRTGAGVAVGPQTHALGVAGTGQRRDFYFCSDLCSPIIDRLSAIIAVLPRNHPERAIFQDLLSRARGASRRLKQGRLTPEDADGIARQISDDIGRHSRQSELFAALMNTDPRLLAEHGPAIRRRLAGDLDVRTTHLASQGERQAANRGSGRARDPLAEPETRSPIETDILGGFDIQNVPRPGKGPQPLHFDVGNFSHTHAEALVPGLPRGLNKEVPVTLPDGTVGRADRVQFHYDADGDRIGAHVFEIKPNTPDNITAGQDQVQQYVAGLRTEIESALRAKGKTVPTTAPNGGPLYQGQVMTYNFEQMTAVLRALRASRRDAARLAEFEAIARQVFGNAP